MGYTTEKNKYVNSKESIIFDDFTLDAKFVDFPYMVKSSAIKILTLKDVTKDNIRFNFELLSNHKFNMLGHARHYISVVQPEEVFIPNKQEQDKIGELFSNLDNLITLHQRKFNYILSHKLEIKLFFFKIIKNVWEQRELFDVADYRNGKAHENDIDNDGKYIVINSKFVSTEGKIKKYSNKQNEPLFQNEIAFVLSDVPNGRAIAKTFLVDKSSKYTLNQRIAGITPHSNINPKFLSITMNKNKYFLQFDDGVKQTNLSLNDMKKFEEFYPNKQEQDKIGDLFTNLDNLITLHQRKCTYIFYSWEQRKLGELYNFRYGDGNHNPSNGGKYDVYGANGIIGGYDKFNSEDSIIIGHMGEYAGSVLWAEGKHFVTYNGTITRPKRNNIDDKFGYYMLYRKELNKICGGSGLPFLSYQELNKVEVNYSKNKDEQIKISKLLTDLDNLITLHQHKELKRRNDNNDNLRW